MLALVAFCGSGAAKMLRTVITHGIKVGALEIRQEKGILGKGPGPVSHRHGVRRVASSARRRKLVWCRRHDGDDVEEAKLRWSESIAVFHLG